MTRRDRIADYVRITDAAKQATVSIRTTGPARLPVELAERVDRFLEAADALVALLGDEILALEGARDWGEP